MGLPKGLAAACGMAVVLVALMIEPARGIYRDFRLLNEGVGTRAQVAEFWEKPGSEGARKDWVRAARYYFRTEDGVLVEGKTYSADRPVAGSVDEASGVVSVPVLYLRNQPSVNRPGEQETRKQLVARSLGVAFWLLAAVLLVGYQLFKMLRSLRQRETF